MNKKIKKLAIIIGALIIISGGVFYTTRPRYCYELKYMIPVFPEYEGSKSYSGYILHSETPFETNPDLYSGYTYVYYTTKDGVYETYKFDIKYKYGIYKVPHHNSGEKYSLVN
jgi:hypothetical protein